MRSIYQRTFPQKSFSSMEMTDCFTMWDFSLANTRLKRLTIRFMIKNSYPLSSLLQNGVSYWKGLDYPLKSSATIRICNISYLQNSYLAVKLIGVNFFCTLISSFSIDPVSKAKSDALTRRSGDLLKEGDGCLQQMVQIVLKPHNLDSAVKKDLFAAPLVIKREKNLDDWTLE